MKTTFILALAFAATVAHAQASLLSPAKSLTPAQTALIDSTRKQPTVEKVTAVTIDPNALNSTVISVDIDGKTYRFTGRLQKIDATIDGWSSETSSEPETRASFTRTGGDVHGTIVIREQYYGLESGMLVKSRQVPAPRIVEPKPIKQPEGKPQ